MIPLLDAMIHETLRHERTPLRFVMPAERYDGIIDDLVVFDDVRCHGHTVPLSRWFLWHYQDERTPFVPVAGSHVFARHLTVAAVLAMRDAARQFGISHYRSIPLVVDDEQAALRLESKPWGDG